MLIRTKTGEAYNLGSLEAQEMLGVGSFEIFDGSGCGLTSHQDPVKALGRIVDKETALKYPLSHPNAIMEGSRVQAINGYKAVYRAKWSGPAYQVRTAAGSRLTIGPNHPVLTARGWLRASLLCEGDQVVSRTGHGQVSVNSADVDLNQVESVVEDTFAAIHQIGTHTRVVAAPNYLHGDGEFCQGEVDVVSVADHSLPVVLDVQVIEQVGEDSFVSAAVRSGYRRSGGAESFGPGGVNLTTTGIVRRGDVGWVTGAWTDFDAELAEAFTDYTAGTTEHLSELLGCSTREVALDEIIEVRYVESWSGHAYDLETGSGVYWCDGILVHNCRRSFGARPDVKTAAHAEQASSHVTAEQIADNAAADRERARAQEARRYRRRSLTAPRPISRRAARRATAGESLSAARTGNVRVPTRRGSRR